MDLPIKIEKEETDYFITSTSDNAPNDEYSNKFILLDPTSGSAIKQEAASDINESEYYEYVDEDSEAEQTQNDIEAADENELSTEIPRKTKEKYLKAYDKFKTWCCTNKVNKINEKVLVTYFTTELNEFKASSTWSIYSMLKSTLNVNDNVEISTFHNLKALLKRKNDGYNAKQSYKLKKEDVYRFIREANNSQFLVVKVALIVGIYGACRRDELVKMSVNDVEYTSDGSIKIKIPATFPKIGRQFVIPASNDCDVNMVDLIKRYISLRPDNVPNSRFFICYRQGRCTRQPVGINTIGAYPEKIATFLELPCANNYTGHCFRRSSPAFLADSGISTTIVRRYRDLSSDKVAESYVENSLNKRKIGDLVSGQKITKRNDQESPTISARTHSVDMPEDHCSLSSSDDDAEATNSSISKNFATKDEDISDLNTNDQKSDPHLYILKKIFEEQTKHTDQLQKLNENLQKLVQAITEKIP